MPALVDLYWAAGILEGEGSFVVRKASRNQKQRYLRTQCQMNDEDVIHRLCCVLGGRMNGPDKCGRYGWAAGDGHSRQLMPMLYSLMGKRRRGQVRAAILSVRKNETEGHGQRPGARKFY